MLLAVLVAIVTVQPSRLSRADGGWSTTDLSNMSETLPSGDVFGIHWEIGNYYSDGLQIYGLICYPDPRFMRTFQPPFPVLLINHGLAAALGPPNVPPFPAIVRNSFNGCLEMAAFGWLVATSTYRGESIGAPTSAPEWEQLPVEAVQPPGFTKTSQWAPAFWLSGGVELCGGEVHDVLNLLSAVKTLTGANPNQSLANPNQVLMWGHSHGSCITERAIESLPTPTTGPFPPKLVAVSIDGPTDFMTWKQDPFNDMNDPGGQQRHARSSSYPPNNPSQLANISLVQFLRIQAENDTNVTPDQGCELAAALGPPSTKFPSTNFYFNSAATMTAQAGHTPKECVGWPTLSWQHLQYLPNIAYEKLGSAGFVWTAPTLLMYSDQPLPNLDEHASIPIQSWPQWASFVNAFIGGGIFEKPWNASIPPQYIPFE
jgi:hypothetical protein